jgi:hypothetical protein
MSFHDLKIVNKLTLNAGMPEWQTRCKDRKPILAGSSGRRKAAERL